MKNILTAFNKLSVGQQVGALAAFNTITLVVVFMICLGAFQATKTQLNGLAQQLMPLTASVSDATVDHLEQAVAFEQYLRLSESESISDVLGEAKGNFEKYGKLFVKAIQHAEEVVAEAMKQDLSPQVAAKFELVNSRIDELKQQHLKYEAGFEEVIAGDVKDQALIKELTSLEKELAVSFETLMGELESFTNELALEADSTTQEAIQNVTIIGALAVALGMVISWFVAAGMTRTARDANVMRQCLTSLKNNVLIADHNDNLVYMNNSSESALRELQGEIRKKYSNFDVDKIIGASIHQMHADPDRVRRILQGLKPGQFHSGKIKISELTLQLNVGPIYDGDKRVGSYAEWRDVTQEIAAAEQQEKLEKNIEETAVRVNEASSQIAEGNMNLSERTEAQAANIEETTATVQQVTERVQENAQNAQEALEIASTTRDAANRGGEVVRHAIRAMEEINDSSTRISDIIGVIDEIAFQTNLLALNAAVEAARAGEQGRGFAVVAAEVRTLAGRSAKAAKEIKDLITESVSKVKTGSQQVNDTGECLNDIIDNVQRVTQMMNEISNASHEQAGSISEVNKSVTQMDSFTQQNAALVEEAAAASRSLEEQASSLIQMIARDEEVRAEKEQGNA